MQKLPIRRSKFSCFLNGERSGAIRRLAFAKLSRSYQIASIMNSFDSICINQSFYVILPSALAQAFDVEKGEEFEWIIEDKNLLLLQRAKPKKKFASKKVKD